MTNEERERPDVVDERSSGGVDVVQCRLDASVLGCGLVPVIIVFVAVDRPISGVLCSSLVPPTANAGYALEGVDHVLDGLV
ncbi:hypothetical protein [Haloterrigena salinisoli]|uniref:hypothetical protein n=1 Tax=Haloterrigena salinisoli TaxID=3132747 RepID=UPI0030CAE057